MKTIITIVILILVAVPVQAHDLIAESCKKSATYRDRKAYYVDQEFYRKCVVKARKQAEEMESKKLQDDANQAIIDSNKTYQKNSEDMGRWMRANPGQLYPYPQTYSGTSQRTKVNRK